MPYVPSIRAQEAAAQAGENQASLANPITALRDSIAAGNLAPAAFIDAIDGYISGGVTELDTAAPLFGGPVVNIGTIGITQSGAASDGYLSSTDWNSFNNKVDRGASTSDLQLTTIVQTTIATLTPTVQGNYLISGYLRIITNPTGVVIQATFTDGSGVQDTVTLMNDPNTGVGRYPLPTFLINSVTSPITITATASATNQVYISAAITAL